MSSSLLHALDETSLIGDHGYSKSINLYQDSEDSPPVHHEGQLSQQHQYHQMVQQQHHSPIQHQYAPSPMAQHFVQESPRGDHMYGQPTTGYAVMHEQMSGHYQHDSCQQQYAGIDSSDTSEEDVMLVEGALDMQDQYSGTTCDMNQQEIQQYVVSSTASTDMPHQVVQVPQHQGRICTAYSQGQMLHYVQSPITVNPPCVYEHNAKSEFQRDHIHGVPPPSAIPDGGIRVSNNGNVTPRRLAVYASSGNPSPKQLVCLTNAKMSDPMQLQSQGQVHLQAGQQIVHLPSSAPNSLNLPNTVMMGRNQAGNIKYVIQRGNVPATKPVPHKPRKQPGVLAKTKGAKPLVRGQSLLTSQGQKSKNEAVKVVYRPATANNQAALSAIQTDSFTALNHQESPPPRPTILPRPAVIQQGLNIYPPNSLVIQPGQVVLPSPTNTSVGQSMDVRAQETVEVTVPAVYTHAAPRVTVMEPPSPPSTYPVDDAPGQTREQTADQPCPPSPSPSQATTVDTTCSPPRCISPENSTDSGSSEQHPYITGQEYVIKYGNGNTNKFIWDGKYFKPVQESTKVSVAAPVVDAGQVRGGGGGTRAKQQRVLKGNATGMHMQQSRPKTPTNRSQGTTVILKQVDTGSGQRTFINGGRNWNHSQFAKDQLNRRPLHSTGAALSVEIKQMETKSEAGPSTEEMTNDTADQPQGKLKEKVTIQQPPRPKFERPPQKPGMFAMCHNCGNMSLNYDQCDSCKKYFPEKVKYYDQGKKAKIIRTPTKSAAQKGACVQGKSGGQTNVKEGGLTPKTFYNNKIAEQMQAYEAQGGKAIPVLRRKPLARHGKKRTNKPAEIETVTISSSDEEDDTSASGSMSRPETPAEFNNSVPGSMLTVAVGTELSEDSSINLPQLGESPVPSPSGADSSVKTSRKSRMEDEKGNVVGAHRTRGKRKANDIDDEEEEERGFSPGPDSLNLQVAMRSRSVRVGTLKGVPYDPIVFSPQKIAINMESEIDTVKIDIFAKDVLKVMAHLKEKMPVVFLYTTPGCALRVRQICNMTVKSGAYFDPGSTDETQKRITIIMENGLSNEDTERLRRIFLQMKSLGNVSEGPILHEIDYTLANRLLVTSTPNAQRIVSQAYNNFSVGGYLPLHAYDDENDEEEEDDDEPVDRSRSPSPPRPIFSEPVIKMLTYPPPPATGGITVTNEDLFCLNDGEFLNDVIIDFYLKYLYLERLCPADRERTHVFSSFFYRRLTQKQTRRSGAEDMLNLTPQEKRHSRVKTWTRHVDLFKKDFIIVPINESAHWYLAIICFPWLRQPVFYHKYVTNVQQNQAKSSQSLATSSEAENQGEEEKAGPTEDPDESRLHSEGESSSVPETTVSPGDSTSKAPKPKETDEPMDTNQAEVDTQEGSEEGSTSGAPVDTTNNKKGIVIQKTVPLTGIEKQPCILIFDSLAGPSRSSVVRTLREYLKVEWDLKKQAEEGSRVFDRETIKGGNPKCPQQSNFSDCGVYVLQYVESFFETPITNYAIPMKSLAEWFPEERVNIKRDQMRDLIHELAKKHNPDFA